LSARSDANIIRSTARRIGKDLYIEKNI
jgi:hypothetical protein